MLTGSCVYVKHCTDKTYNRTQAPSAGVSSSECGIVYDTINDNTTETKCTWLAVMPMASAARMLSRDMLHTARLGNLNKKDRYFSLSHAVLFQNSIQHAHMQCGSFF